MKKKKVMAMMLSVLMAATLMTGCGGSDDANGGKSKSEKSDKGEQVTLRFSWWGGDERNEATLQVIDNYEKEHPNIKIEPEFGGDEGYLEKLSTSLAGGQAADIIQNGTGWMPGFVEKGDFFVDFNDYKDDIDLSGFSDEYLDNTCVFDGKLLGLPSGVATTALLVNKTLADETGIDLTKDVTWESLIEMGKKVQEHDNSQYLLNIDTSFLVTNVFRPYIMQMTGKPLIDDDTKKLTCSEEQLVSVLAYIQSLYENHVTQPAGETASFEDALQTNPKWINGDYVAVMTNSSQINNLTAANENVEYIVASMPEMSDKSVQKNDGYYANPPQLMCVNKSGKHVKEAVKFLDYFYNNEDAAKILKDLRSVPPTENARKICEENGLIGSLVTDSVNKGLEKHGVNEMGLTTDSEVESVIKTMIESVKYGESTPDKAASDGISMLNNILSEK
ncbi:sugar ABC transporter substrate-binding protein [Blautia liquoris]|uniref:Sugar ABC transporter substrate-binding protein n=1 Tax=Blautia liquoris TaxID=2779518 RepID=A0A7M2RJ97_9FIRM|nr:sugar ABC transporter substrate-binding protein [Blautia liquoris]QOV20393.1 sugar ABC transporter substrate-binding protein [Blautia liquoris]